MRSKGYLLRQGMGIFAITLVLLFLLSFIWEFWLASWAIDVLGLPFRIDSDLGERWRFIMTSTCFAALAMIGPGLLSLRLTWRLRYRYRQLLATRAQSDHLARHDALTGLMNRHYFMECLHARLKPQLEQTAVLVIDIDAFRVINDTHGNAAGDYALRKVATRLKGVRAIGDLLMARLGGDEFIMVLTGALSRGEIQQQAQVLLKSLRQPLACGNGRVTLDATIGIALSPQHATSADRLLKAAYDAMYTGKQQNRRIFFQKSALPEEEQNRLRCEQALRQALVEGEIVPFYQPIVDLTSRAIMGVELLARWQHPKRGLVPPDEFIPLIEELGLMPDMTQQLLLQALQDSQQWPEHLFVAINITTSYLENEGFTSCLAALIEAHGVPPERLEIEITENALIERLEIAQHNLDRLHDMGVRVSLDDFGTGYSGLYHLARLDIDKIKIDRSFFDADEIRQDNLVRLMIAMGRSLGMKVVAEGIEDEGLARRLAAQGCDLGQGYLFGRPVPASTLTRLLDESAAVSTGSLDSVSGEDISTGSVT